MATRRRRRGAGGKQKTLKTTPEGNEETKRMRRVKGVVRRKEKARWNDDQHVMGGEK